MDYLWIELVMVWQTLGIHRYCLWIHLTFKGQERANSGILEENKHNSTLPPTRIACVNIWRGQTTSPTFRRIQFYNKSLLQSPFLRYILLFTATTSITYRYIAARSTRDRERTAVKLMTPRQWNIWQRESDSWSVWIYAHFYSSAHLTHYK